MMIMMMSLEEPLAQVKGQVEIQKVSIASERLLENETQCILG